MAFTPSATARDTAAEYSPHIADLDDLSPEPRTTASLSDRVPSTTTATAPGITHKFHLSDQPVTETPENELAALDTRPASPASGRDLPNNLPQPSIEQETTEKDIRPAPLRQDAPALALNVPPPSRAPLQSYRRIISAVVSDLDQDSTARGARNTTFDPETHVITLARTTRVAPRQLPEEQGPAVAPESENRWSLSDPPPAPPFDDGLRSMHDVGLDIRPSQGELPQDFAARKFAMQGQLYQPVGTNRPWPLYHYTWQASAFCHGPLYFEEVNLERHGHTALCAQPVLSAAHFFGTIPALPYLMTAQKPCECIYTAGQYRPGSCAPYRVNCPPCSFKGAVVQGLTVTGMIFLIP
jgi:hypothetical protein